MSAWDDHKKKKGYVAETKQTETSPSRQEGEASAWDRHKASAAGQAAQSQIRRNTVDSEIAAKKGKNALRYQRSQLEGTKTATDADWAGYYGNEAAYNAQYGKPWQADNSYQKYKALADKVNQGYADRIAANRQKDYAEEDYDILRGVTSPASVANRAANRLSRDEALYMDMAETAGKVGSQDMWDRASRG